MLSVTVRNIFDNLAIRNVLVWTQPILNASRTERIVTAVLFVSTTFCVSNRRRRAERLPCSVPVGR